MKTKSSIRPLIPTLAAALAVATLLHASPPADAPSPEALAAQKVVVEILNKVSPPVRPFSRAAPMPQHRLEFQPQLLVDGESRLPFAIKPTLISIRPANGPTHDGKAPPALLEGYVRLRDQEIFLYHVETKSHVPASQHPRFAPKPPVQLDPAKPA